MSAWVYLGMLVKVGWC